ncbi:MAG: NADH-quinone oxidoreductase subunit J [Candidatus Brocadiales bacterium]
MEQILFYIAFTITVVSAASVVLQGRVMYSVLSLIVTLLGVAWIYAMLSAPFLAIVQVILYAGAIVVLLLFAVMMLKFDETVQRRLRPDLLGVIGALVALVFAGMFVSLVSCGCFEFASIPADYGSIKSIGSVLYTQYLIPLELASVLLLVAVVGAVMLAGRR